MAGIRAICYSRYNETPGRSAYGALDIKLPSDAHIAYLEGCAFPPPSHRPLMHPTPRLGLFM